VIRSTLPPSQPYNIKSLQCLYQTVPYGTGVLWCAFPGNKLPGYDQLVPPGQKNLRSFKNRRNMLTRFAPQDHSITPRAIAPFFEHGTKSLAKRLPLAILLTSLCLNNPRSRLTMEMLSRSSASESGRCPIRGQLKWSAMRFLRAIV